MTSKFINWLLWHKLIPDIKYFEEWTLKMVYGGRFRSNITDFMDILRKITNNDVNNDVMWRQNWKIDYFDINSKQRSHILRDKLSKWYMVVVFRSNISDFIDILRRKNEKMTSIMTSKLINWLFWYKLTPDITYF